MKIFHILSIIIDIFRTIFSCRKKSEDIINYSSPRPCSYLLRDGCTENLENFYLKIYHVLNKDHDFILDI